MTVASRIGFTHFFASVFGDNQNVSPVRNGVLRLSVSICGMNFLKIKRCQNIKRLKIRGEGGSAVKINGNQCYIPLFTNDTDIK